MKEIKNKISFTIKNAEGKEIELFVKKPDAKQTKELTMVYNATFSEALKSGAVLRAKVESVARSQNLWDDEKEEESNKLRKEIAEKSVKLEKGGKAGLTKTQAVDLAKDIRKLRRKLNELLAPRNDVDNNSCEAQAENAKFNHMVALCTYFKEDTKPYFKSYDDYIERYNNEDQEIYEIIRNVSYLQYGVDPNSASLLSENKVLIKLGKMDAKCRLINEDGHLVDEEGRLINEKGQFVNKENETVDIFGNRIDDKGNYIVDSSEFLED